MSYQDDRMNDIQASIQNLENVKRLLREREKNLKAREQYLSNPRTFPVNNVANLRNTMLGALPGYMMPGNVGGVNEVTWPFLFNTTLDFGANPSIADNVFARNFFQVDQEAAFLVMAISRAHQTDEDNISATINAPIQIEFIDRQSSRRFMSEPMPLQMLGSNSLPSIYPTAFYMPPNSVLDIVASGIPPAAAPIDYTGSGAFQLSFFGNRIRTEDAQKVLSTIFGKI